MKRCPYCAESIQDEAIKCKHCFEFLDGRPRSDQASPSVRPRQRPPWYFSTSFMLFTFIAFPPFVLPSVWLHPRMHWVFKVLITALVAGFCWVSWWSINRFLHQFDEATRMWQEAPI